ncbi:maternal effect protein staufen isoform X2 [Toxorhynchites rutilus septentrionalis]|uniref:maternal effect protein staufen isoform X2 n=1 Tax=Toxorhynchites rutilus septentrionalis TaxID=329112 RepID=UPI00247A2AA9|nr:maternal effect protein staufen isoform X2 [Toxorhynchites rutilus septentrionalis]
MLHVPPPQPQQHMAHPPTQPPPPLPSHLPHLTSVPPPNVPTQGSAGQHPGPRITNRHHHHQRVSAAGEHHQAIPALRMPLQQQNSRKSASHHYVSNNMIGNGGMPSKHQQAPMGHPPKSLSYHQHHHPTHHGHPNTIVIPVVSAAGSGGSKTRMIPAHDPKNISKPHSNALLATNNTSSNTKGIHQVEPPIQLSGGIPSSTTTGTVGTNTSNTSTTTGTVSIPVGGSGGGGGDSNIGGGAVTSTASLAPIVECSSDSIPKDSTSQQLQPNQLPLTVSETLANNKEKTPMCLVNELARYNKLQHQYRLTGESGPAHKKRFTVTLKLGDEEYTAEGPSIKKAQHTAANEAVGKTKYKHPPAKTSRAKSGGKTSIGNITPTVELNALAMKRGEPTVYESEEVVVTPKYTHPPPGRPNAPQPNVSGGGHSYFPAPPPGTHYSCFHRNNGMYNSAPPTGVRYGAPQHQTYGRRNPIGGKMDYHSRGYYYNHHMPHVPQSVPELYKVTLHVGERTFLGEGHTLQAARHDAAARALEVLKPLTPDTNNAGSEFLDTSLDSDDPNSELKSPISLVHEMALKRKLSVQFEVLGEKGPPHMKVFTTLCKVGNIITEGEGNGKKLSKKRAAEKMLEELRKLPPTAPEKSTCSLLKQKRKLPLPKKKTRNLIKENADEDPLDMVNPISRLMQIQQAQKEKEPVYTLLEERGLARRREFIMEVSVGGMTATGMGPTKKLAKKEAAESLLVMLGHVRSPTANAFSPNKENIPVGANEIAEKTGRKVTDGTGASTVGKHGGSAGRQIVPGVLQLNTGVSNKSLSDLPSLRESSQETNINTEAHSPDIANTARVASPTKSSTGIGSATTAPSVTQNTTASKNTTGTKPPTVGRMKEQLMYLAQLLKFEVLFSDFPKGNHGEYLTLVTLSTEPPQLCHGGGASLEESHDEAARGALDILSKIGLDNVTPKGSASTAAASSAADDKLSITSNLSTSNEGIIVSYKVSVNKGKEEERRRIFA